jgi:sulfur dioxygenase
MIFTQLFEPVSCTYTYLLGCEQTGLAVLIDPVMPAWEHDLAQVRSRGLRLAYTLDTHIHADHITAALKLKRECGSLIANAASDALPCTDFGIVEGTPLEVGSLRLDPLHTPGHTDNHFSLVCGERVFTGDALLIGGCGRTDFQNGDARALYHSVHRKLFALPGETRVFPAHDYHGRLESTIARERESNPRLGGGRSLDEFVAIMAALDLPYPRFIDHAVPGNRSCGVCPENLPPDLAKYCEGMAESPQG